MTADETTEAELDAMVAYYLQRPGALAVDEWKLYRQLLEDVEHAEHPDITDGYGRAWRWFGRGNTYVHDDALAYPLEWIPQLGLPNASLADNPNYSLCEICKRDWPEAAKAEYGIWRDGCLWPDRVLPWQMAKAIELRAQGLFAPYDHRFARLVKQRDGEWSEVKFDA